MKKLLAASHCDLGAKTKEHDQTLSDLNTFKTRLVDEQAHKEATHAELTELRTRHETLEQQAAELKEYGAQQGKKCEELGAKELAAENTIAEHRDTIAKLEATIQEQRSSYDQV